MVDVETLISLVYERPAIWDKRIKLHQNRNIVDQCWLDISNVMETEETILRKKWKYLRDQYSVELTKVSQSAGSGQPSKWHCFGLLTFLNEVVKPRGYRNSSFAIKDEYGDEIIVNNAESSSFDIEGASESSPHSQSPHQCRQIQADDLHIMNQNNDDSDYNDINTTTSLTKHRKRENPFGHEMDLVDDKRRKLECLLEKSIIQNEEKFEDEDFMFFKSLLSHVKNIPHSKKLKFRSQILQTVQDFEHSEEPSSDSPKTTFHSESSNKTHHNDTDSLIMVCNKEVNM